MCEAGSKLKIRAQNFIFITLTLSPGSNMTSDPELTTLHGSVWTFWRFFEKTCVTQFLCLVSTPYSSITLICSSLSALPPARPLRRLCCPPSLPPRIYLLPPSAKQNGQLCSGPVLGSPLSPSLPRSRASSCHSPSSSSSAKREGHHRNDSQYVSAIRWRL